MTAVNVCPPANRQLLHEQIAHPKKLDAFARANLEDIGYGT